MKMKMKMQKMKILFVCLFVCFTFPLLVFFFFSLLNERHEISFLSFPHFWLVENEIVPICSWEGFPQLGR